MLVCDRPIDHNDSAREPFNLDFLALPGYIGIALLRVPQPALSDRRESNGCPLWWAVSAFLGFQFGFFGNFRRFWQLSLRVPLCPLWLKVLDRAAQLNHLQRRLCPVMPPAHNQV